MVIAARVLRTFGYGCRSVLLAEMLTQDGDAPWQTGLLLVVAAAGSVASRLLLIAPWLTTGQAPSAATAKIGPKASSLGGFLG